VGIRYSVIRVYPLFCWTKSKTIKNFGLKILEYKGLAVCILRVNGLNTNRSAIKVRRMHTL